MDYSEGNGSVEGRESTVLFDEPELMSEAESSRSPIVRSRSPRQVTQSPSAGTPPIGPPPDTAQAIPSFPPPGIIPMSEWERHRSRSDSGPPQSLRVTYRPGYAPQFVQIPSESSTFHPHLAPVAQGSFDGPAWAQGPNPPWKTPLFVPPGLPVPVPDISLRRLSDPPMPISPVASIPESVESLRRGLSTITERTEATPSVRPETPGSSAHEVIPGSTPAPSADPETHFSWHRSNATEHLNLGPGWGAPIREPSTAFGLPTDPQRTTAQFQPPGTPYVGQPFPATPYMGPAQGLPPFTPIQRPGTPFNLPSRPPSTRPSGFPSDYPGYPDAPPTPEYNPQNQQHLYRPWGNPPGTPWTGSMEWGNPQGPAPALPPNIPIRHPASPPFGRPSFSPPEYVPPAPVLSDDGRGHRVRWDDRWDAESSSENPYDSPPPPPTYTYPTWAPPPGPAAPPADIWPQYAREARRQDNTRLSNYDRDMDVILVFAALFSAILTAFVIEFYNLLQPDSADDAVDLLVSISTILNVIALNQIGNFTEPPQFNPSNPSDSFIPSAAVLWINGMWFMSLAVSLGTAMAAMLVKQWIQSYQNNLITGPTDDTYIHRRQYRYNGFLAWRVPGIISALPLCMHFSVMLFLFGLIILLWELNLAIGLAVLVFIAVLLLAYFVTLLLPLVFVTCPYRTSIIDPVQRLFHWMKYVFFGTLYQMVKGLNELTEYPWSLTHKLQLRYRAPYRSLADNAEADRIQKKEERLDLDCMIWLLGHSTQGFVVDSTLQSIPNLPASTPRLAERLLEYDVLELLWNKAYVPLPQETDDFWSGISKTPDTIVPFLGQARERECYLKSLLHVWKQDIYLDDRHPPARLQQEAQLPREEWLLPNWIKLWRTLRLHHGPEPRQLFEKGWQLNEFATIICAEVFYHHLQLGYHQPNGQPPSIDPNPLDDLVSLLEAGTSNSDSASPFDSGMLCMLLDTLVHALARISEEDESKYRSRILISLISLGEGTLPVTDLAFRKVIHSIRVITAQDSASRKQVIRGEIEYESRSQYEEVVYDSLVVFLQGYANNCEDKKRDEIRSRSTRWLFYELFEEETPTDRFNNLFIHLPVHTARELVRTVEFGEKISDRWHSPNRLNWVIGLVKLWYRKQADVDVRTTILDLLCKIVKVELPTKSDFEVVSGRVLIFFKELMETNTRDAALANYVCRRCAHLVRYSLASSPELWKRILDLGVVNVVCMFLRTRKLRWYTTVTEWDAIIPEWKKAMNRRDDVKVKEKKAFSYLRRVVGVFPDTTAS